MPDEEAKESEGVSRSLLYIVVAVAVLIGGYFLLKPKPKTTTQPKTVQVMLAIENKKLVSGNETTTVKEGDTVIFHITGDSDEEFHLHGYDKSVILDPKGMVELEVKADKTGHFPFELEQSKTDLGALDVEPR